jgi:Phage integrase, N-terminal SAM-like domain
VGFSRERAGKDGNPRFIALYRDLKGRQRSAGTYTSKRQADRAWRRAAARLELGRVGDPGKGRQTIRRYVEEKTWLPTHEVEVTTRQSYTYALYRHIMPEFGDMWMIDITPAHVRAQDKDNQRVRPRRPPQGPHRSAMSSTSPRPRPAVADVQSRGHLVVGCSGRDQAKGVEFSFDEVLGMAARQGGGPPGPGSPAAR